MGAAGREVERLTPLCETEGPAMEHTVSLEHDSIRTTAVRMDPLTVHVQYNGKHMPQRANSSKPGTDFSFFPSIFPGASPVTSTGQGWGSASSALLFHHEGGRKGVRVPLSPVTSTNRLRHMPPAEYHHVRKEW